MVMLVCGWSLVLNGCSRSPQTESHATSWVGDAPESWVRFVSLPDLAVYGRFEAPHAVTRGTVTSITGQRDGDFHISLTAEGARIVLEPIPQRPLSSLPRVGEPIEAWGIVRWDLEHDWGELHPLLGWRRHGRWNGPNFVCRPENCKV